MISRSAISRQRLHNQRLVGPKFDDPVKAIAWLGAVQAQDFTAAKWSLALRLNGFTSADLDRAFNAGRFLRTHVMRPTWHFIAPGDLRWMQSLTSARARRGLSSADRKLDLTPSLLSRARHIIAKALSGQHLSRLELAGHLERGGIVARGQRLAHILGHMEFDCLICSGPLQGRQFTYALVDDRIPATRVLSRDEALATLARRYFTSHGPAQLSDFCWWSGLSPADSAEAVELAKPRLLQQDLDGSAYWSAQDRATAGLRKPHARLLALWDEYVIAYQDRRAIAPSGLLRRLLSMGAAVTALMVLDGQVVGTWRRRLLGRRPEITMEPMRRLTARERDAFAVQARRYQAFLQQAD